MNQFMDFVLIACGGTLGIAVGYSFGLLQFAAFNRHQRLQQNGNFRSGWSIMPGSFRRGALLLAALGAIQLLVPRFFESALTEWTVSAGVVLGYGFTLYKQLGVRIKQH